MAQCQSGLSPVSCVWRHRQPLIQVHTVHGCFCVPVGKLGSCSRGCAAWGAYLEQLLHGPVQVVFLNPWSWWLNKSLKMTAWLLKVGINSPMASQVWGFTIVSRGCLCKETRSPVPRTQATLFSSWWLSTRNRRSSRHLSSSHGEEERKKEGLCFL